MATAGPIPQDGVPYGLYDCFVQAQGTYPAPAAPRDVLWFERARLGMFVHWNHSSVAKCEISWAMQRGDLTMKDYEALAQRFNPVDFSATDWVARARDAGMGYFLLVVKHHDGFAMWDTDTSDYQITRTPFRRDVCREIADACHAAGMRLGWYYSPADWWHPASRAARWDEYVPYMQVQIRELMTRYGHVDFLAFDYWSPACLHPSWAEFYRELRRTCPSYLHSRNTPWAFGDYEVQEHDVPYVRDARSTQRAGITANNGFESRMTCAAPFEVLRSIQGGRWSYNDGKALPLTEVVSLLTDAAGCGGNLTLNVTPEASGVIPPAQQERLRELGAWMRVHGEALLGTRGGPLPPLLARKREASAPESVAPEMLGGSGQRPRGLRCVVATTSVGERIYVHVRDWMGASALLLPGLARRVVGCRLLGGRPLRTEMEGDRLRVTVPAALRGESGTVIALEVDGPAAEIECREPPALA